MALKVFKSYGRVKAIMGRFYSKQEGLFCIPLLKLDSEVLDAMVSYLLQSPNACISSINDYQGIYPRFEGLKEEDWQYIVTPDAKIINHDEVALSGWNMDVINRLRYLRDKYTSVGDGSIRFSKAEYEIPEVALEIDKAIYESALASRDTMLGLFLEKSERGMEYVLREIEAPL